MAPGLMLVIALSALSMVALCLAADNPVIPPAPPPLNYTTLPLDSCLSRQMRRDESKERPIVMNKDPKWVTMLSLDAGNFRAAIYSAILCELEERIKYRLIAKGKVAYKNIDDFDVRVPDWFDIMPGCSAGTYVQTYLLTSGVNARTVFPSIQAADGSATASFEYMMGLASWYNETMSALTPAQQSNYSVTGPLLRDGYADMFKTQYGNATLHDFRNVRTSAIWAWTDLGGNTALAPYMDKHKFRGGMDTLSTSGTDMLNQDQNFYLWQEQNFYLWQMVAGATSWPPRQTPLLINTTADSKDQATYLIADGIIAAMDPVTLGVNYLLRHTKTTLPKLAILSLGSGAVLNSSLWESTDATQYVQGWQNGWNSVGANKFAAVPSMQQIMREINPPQQYLRIDYTFNWPDDCLDLFTADVCPKVINAVKYISWDNTELYATIGTQLARQYSDQIKDFVQYLI
ncbi:hypothetical protein FOA52_011531 [Chlamydomonas sp. UWO 241]|nr:hypothetical protein FOA52_011531 [Chlamydomonas sp. UWO 241]